jgi:hypothetical protein
VSGSIQDSKRLPRYRESVIDFALGLRDFNDKNWPDISTRLKSAIISVDLKGIVTSTVTEDNGQVHIRTYDSRNHFALLNYSAFFPSGQKYIEYSNSNFSQIGGLELPASIVERDTYWESGQEHVSRTVVLSNIKYVLNDPKNTTDSYYMMWKKGSIVADLRIGRNLSVKSGDRTLTDKEIYQIFKDQGDTDQP